MASSAAALLDELMGRNRNANPNEDGGNIKWNDPQVCRHFLCGYCPSELFTNTKADLGPCSLIHDEPLRREYQSSDRFEKMGYEERWIEALEDIVNDVDKKIKRGHQRLAMTQEGEQPQNQSHGPKQEQIVQLTTKINDLVENAERLGNEGKVEEAQGVMKLCEQLRKERYHLENLSNDRQDHISQAKQMEVCPVCGAFLIVGDAESRQREHLMGKQHMGYAQMRATVDEFKDRKRQKIAAHKAEMEKKREDERKQREEREKARRRSRSRDRRGQKSSRDKDRDRRRSRSKDRVRRRTRSRDRRRSRSRDRVRRSRSRDRRRSRSSGRRKSRSPAKRRSRSGDRKRSRDRRSNDRSKRSRSRDRGNQRDSRRSSRASSRDRVQNAVRSERSKDSSGSIDRTREENDKTKDKVEDNSETAAGHNGTKDPEDVNVSLKEESNEGKENEEIKNNGEGDEYTTTKESKDADSSQESNENREPVN